MILNVWDVMNTWGVTIDPPVADAGVPQTGVPAGQLVTLAGSYTSSVTATYFWTAPAGITLDDRTSRTPSFVAPIAGVTQVLSFTLVVTDTAGLTGTSTTTVTVLAATGTLPTNVVIYNATPVVGELKSLTSGDKQWDGEKWVNKATEDLLSLSSLSTAIINTNVANGRSILNNGTWVTGSVFTSHNQFMVSGGVAYSPAQSTVLPYTVQETPDLRFMVPVQEGTTSLHLVPQSSEPYKQAGKTLAMSDGTASTNSFGVAGEGLYRCKANGLWVLIG